MSDLRFIQLTAWLSDYFSQPLVPSLLSGDASARRYFRVKLQARSYIAVDVPPEEQALDPFIDIANAYTQQGIKVPEVIAKDTQKGFMLLSDLGDRQLLTVLADDNAARYYAAALMLLDDIAKVSATSQQALPLYDTELIRSELNIFSEWLLNCHLNLAVSAKEQAMLAEVFALLIDNANAQPKVGTHRDFHSRNLMLHDDALHVIDFQDAVLGPITYDPVSLLRDCYIRWPDSLVEQLMIAHYQREQAAGRLAASVSLTQYRRWFDLMGLQRHLKAAGIFARLYHRDDKPAYLADIPLTLEYIRDIASSYVELRAFADWVAVKLIPHFCPKQEQA